MRLWNRIFYGTGNLLRNNVPRGQTRLGQRGQQRGIRRPDPSAPYHLESVKPGSENKPRRHNIGSAARMHARHTFYHIRVQWLAALHSVYGLMFRRMKLRKRKRADKQKENQHRESAGEQ